MRPVREAREDDPARRIALEAFRLMDAVLAFILDRDGGIAVVDARRRAQEDGRVVALREVERFLDHLVRFLHARRIKARHLGKRSEVARILLRLRGNRPRIIGDEHDETALDAEILEAHQGVRGDVEADLLHRHKCAGTRPGSARRHFHAGLLVRRPLYVDPAVRVVSGNRLEDLRRRRARIAGDDIDAGRDRPHGDGLIAHQIFYMHSFPLPNLR